MSIWKIFVVWLRWRYRQALKVLTYFFYVYNPLITVIMMSNPETSQPYFRPLENARRREELAELEWRSAKLRRQ